MILVGIRMNLFHMYLFKFKIRFLIIFAIIPKIYINTITKKIKIFIFVFQIRILSNGISNFFKEKGMLIRRNRYSSTIEMLNSNNNFALLQFQYFQIYIRIHLKMSLSYKLPHLFLIYYKSLIFIVLYHKTQYFTIQYILVNHLYQ